MATPLDTPLRATVKAVLDTLGAAATLTRSAEATDPNAYDPVTGDEIPAVPVAYSVKMSPPEPFKISDVDGTTIKMSDLTTLLAAQGLAITPSKHLDKLTFDGTIYVIMGVDPIYSGDSVAAWQLHLRK